MSFGVTVDGFNIKRLSDIQSETEAAFLGEFGSAFDLDPRSPEGILKAIYDERVSTLWELAEDVYFSEYPDFSEGVPLDNAASLTGHTRKAATKSILMASVRLRGTLSTVVPGGTTIFSVQGNSSARFILDSNTTISIAAIDEVQDLAVSAVPDAGNFVLDFEGEQTGSLAHDISASALQSALEGLSGIGSGNVLVSGSFATSFSIKFQGALAGQNVSQITVFSNTLELSSSPVTLTASTTTEGDQAKSPLANATAETAGPTQANAGTLTVIETPVSGLDSVTNELDAEIGSAIESDADFKIRRIQEIQLAGAATIEAIRAKLLEIENVTAAIVFQNNNDVPDIEGRPPHSIDAVVQGGDEDEIAKEIFLVVAGGIQTTGIIMKEVVDSQGFTQEIEFSRPTDVSIWVEVDLTVNTALFPADGLARVEQAILDYAELLSIGDFVVVFGSTPSLGCSFEDVPGIIDFDLRVGKTASPTSDDNIPIAAREIADFDSSRITVSIP